ncbi:MAG: hypothetical protein ACI399_02615, partial [Candidatus Cryptobacteroides sp.]
TSKESERLAPDTLNETLPNDGVMTSSDRRLLSSSDYVHCVFGWGGNYNGYFLNGVFDFMSNETEFDNPNTTSTSRFYSYFLKTITFDNPN